MTALDFRARDFHPAITFHYTFVFHRAPTFHGTNPSRVGQKGALAFISQNSIFCDFSLEIHFAC